MPWNYEPPERHERSLTFAEGYFPGATPELDQPNVLAEADSRSHA